MHAPRVLSALLLSLTQSAVAFSLGNHFSEQGPVPSDASIIALTPQFFPDHHSQRVKISYGPYKVPSMHDHNEMRGYSEPSTTLPCNDCLITWMQAGLEFADGTTANAEAGMWLHHAVFSNVKRRDVVCPMKRHGDRFFASGNERTPVNICREGTEQAGYYIAPDDEISMSVELMNMMDEPCDAILTMTYEYIPFVPKGFDKVKTYWLDIGGCKSSSFPAEPQATFNYSSPPWKGHTTGRVTLVASHLHDGGTNVEVRRNGHVLCDAKAVYGSCEDSSSPNTCTEHIEIMSVCGDLGPTDSDDEWSITAYYDTLAHLPMKNMDGSLEPIMGISLVYVAETPDRSPEPAPARENGILNFVLAFGTLALVIALVIGWIKMNGLSLREVFNLRGRRVSLRERDQKIGSLLLLSEEYRDEE